QWTQTRHHRPLCIWMLPWMLPQAQEQARGKFLSKLETVVVPVIKRNERLIITENYASLKLDPDACRKEGRPCYVSGNRGLRPSGLKDKSRGWKRQTETRGGWRK
ncbi:hypothetical protein ALC62_15768, partial [Cyphomyrmex costatus]